MAMGDGIDFSGELAARVKRAASSGTALRIVGGGSKAFYGRNVVGEALELASHRGIVEYEPTELVLTARAGTTLSEIDETLAQAGQILASEPPRFDDAATIGGAVASNLGGPRRPFGGSLRDQLLGVKLLNGKGEQLRFGGQVIKNVAGYDAARLMAGALGTLGVLLEVSLKVVPAPRLERSHVLEVGAEKALDLLCEWGRRVSPMSAALYDDGRLYCRFSGSEGAVRAASTRFGGEELPDAQSFWAGVRDHRHPFFQGDAPLWRFSVPSAAPRFALEGDWLFDWAGAQRWYRGPESVSRLREVATAAGGHLTLFRGGDADERFHPLDALSLGLHRRLKAALDPAGILNPGRIYADL